jgi:hypothetical protein
MVCTQVSSLLLRQPLLVVEVLQCIPQDQEAVVAKARSYHGTGLLALLTHSHPFCLLAAPVPDVQRPTELLCWPRLLLGMLPANVCLSLCICCLWQPELVHRDELHHIVGHQAEPWDQVLPLPAVVHVARPEPAPGQQHASCH